MKIKTHVLTVSRSFPITHKRKGMPTYFVEKILSTIKGASYLCAENMHKIHTIRANYELWKKRIEEVQDGNAVLSLRYWSGKPYNSKQVEFLVLDKNNNVGIQKLKDPTNFVVAEIDNNNVNWEDVATNDGLSFDDFCNWFKVRINKPMAVIHFTDFRY